MFTLVTALCILLPVETESGKMSKLSPRSSRKTNQSDATDGLKQTTMGNFLMGSKKEKKPSVCIGWLMTLTLILVSIAQQINGQF